MFTRRRRARAAAAAKAAGKLDDNEGEDGQYVPVMEAEALRVKNRKIDSIYEELQLITERLHDAKEELQKEQQLRAQTESELATISEELLAEKELKAKAEEELKAKLDDLANDKAGLSTVRFGHVKEPFEEGGDAFESLRMEMEAVHKQTEALLQGRGTESQGTPLNSARKELDDEKLEWSDALAEKDTQIVAMEAAQRETQSILEKKELEVQGLQNEKLQWEELLGKANRRLKNLEQDQEEYGERTQKEIEMLQAAVLQERQQRHEDQRKLLQKVDELTRALAEQTVGSEEKDRKLADLQEVLDQSKQLLEERNAELQQLRADHESVQERLVAVQLMLQTEREARSVIESDLKKLDDGTEVLPAELAATKTALELEQRLRLKAEEALITSRAERTSSQRQALGWLRERVAQNSAEHNEMLDWLESSLDTAESTEGQGQAETPQSKAVRSSLSDDSYSPDAETILSLLALQLQSPRHSGNASSYVTMNGSRGQNTSPHGNNEDVVQVLAPLVMNWAESEGIEGSDVQEEMVAAINNLSNERMGQLKQGVQRLSVSQGTLPQGDFPVSQSQLTEEQKLQQERDLREVVSILSGPDDSHGGGSSEKRTLLARFGRFVARERSLDINMKAVHARIKDRVTKFEKFQLLGEQEEAAIQETSQQEEVVQCKLRLAPGGRVEVQLSVYVKETSHFKLPTEYKRVHPKEPQTTGRSTWGGNRYNGGTSRP